LELNIEDINEHHYTNIARRMININTIGRVVFFGEISPNVLEFDEPTIVPPKSGQCSKANMGDTGPKKNIDHYSNSKNGKNLSLLLLVFNMCHFTLDFHSFTPSGVK